MVRVLTNAGRLVYSSRIVAVCIEVPLKSEIIKTRQNC
jgi:hypothetical protein